MQDLFIKALTSLKDSKGVLEDVFLKMRELDKTIMQDMLTLDLLMEVHNARDKGLISIKYEPKNRADIIELVSK